MFIISYIFTTFYQVVKLVEDASSVALFVGFIIQYSEALCISSKLLTKYIEAFFFLIVVSE